MEEFPRRVERWNVPFPPLAHPLCSCPSRKLLIPKHRLIARSTCCSSNLQPLGPHLVAVVGVSSSSRVTSEASRAQKARRSFAETSFSRTRKPMRSTT